MGCLRSLRVADSWWALGVIIRREINEEVCEEAVEDNTEAIFSARRLS